MEFETIKQRKQTKRLVVTLIIMSMIAMIMLGYIVKSQVEKTSCEVEKNESYALGFNQGKDNGIEFWNREVINDMVQFDRVPYWVNNSKYYVNLTLMVKERCQNE